MAPEIVSFTDGTLFCDEQTLEAFAAPLCVVYDQQLVHVTAIDPDSDVLEFYWEGSGSGLIGTAVTTYSGEFQNSQVTLTRAMLVDGEVLTCTVSDGSVRIPWSWTVVVL